MSYSCFVSLQQIQDAADQGVMFVGFIQEPRGALCARIREPETPSLSLHSSPSSVLGSLGSCSPSNPSSPNHHPESDVPEKWGNEKDRSESKTCEHTSHREAGVIGDGVSSAASPSSEEDLDRSEELTEEDSLLHNGNKDSRADAKERPRYRLRRGDGEWSPWLRSCSTAERGGMRRVQNRKTCKLHKNTTLHHDGNLVWPFASRSGLNH